MNKKIVTSAVIILLFGLILTIMFNRKTTISKQPTVATALSSEKSLTDHEVVGVWINHHNKEIHQKITFTANYKWRENQNGFTNIYTGNWKQIGDNKVLLTPYDEKIQFYGDDFKTVKVLNYNHILNKETK